ncbi:VOC family protein [Alicyclobacillus macrosporangiidus]|nr:hypothetical protein [Alicyclobacillus macrosporangiidus]
MTRVKNVYFPVADMAAAIRFYESLFGLAPQSTGTAVRSSR